MKEAMVQTLSLVLSVSHVILQFSHMLHLILTPGSLITAVMSDVTKCDVLKLQTGWKLGLRHWETLDQFGSPRRANISSPDPSPARLCVQLSMNLREVAHGQEKAPI